METTWQMSGFTTILAATDFSEYSQPSVDWAVRLAEKCDATLHLLHVVHEPLLAPVSSNSAADELLHARQQLEQVLPPENFLRLEIVRTAVHGSPAEQIVRYAEAQGVDLIVVGTHGRTGLAHALRGSVADRLLRIARCPVVAIPLHRRDQEVVGAGNEVPAMIESRHFDVGGLTPAHDLVNRAVAVRASDLHIDPLSNHEFQVRFRIDGRLQAYCNLERELAERLIHQFKLMANLDVTEPFMPHEGRMRVPNGSSELQVRLTTAPVTDGDAVALRLLSRDSIFRPLGELGFSDCALFTIEQILHRKQGLVLISGPAGSGKTTSAYCMLQALSAGERNIVSIEDPVEFSASFIRQMRVDERHGVTLNSGLRTMLRMDPDVILVSEIRDPDTAETVMRAASAGRYVVSTMHARDVAASLTALRAMHVSHASMVVNLVGIISQRLVRRLCLHCKQTRATTVDEQRLFRDEGIEPPGNVCDASGCDHCGGTGYRGRVGVFEAAVIDGDLADAIEHGASPDEVRRLLRSSGVPTLMGDALLKVQDDVTSLEEARSLTWI